MLVSSKGTMFCVFVSEPMIPSDSEHQDGQPVVAPPPPEPTPVKKKEVLGLGWPKDILGFLQYRSIKYHQIGNRSMHGPIGKTRTCSNMYLE